MLDTTVAALNDGLQGEKRQMRFIVACSTALLISSVGTATELSKEDLERGVKYLEVTHKAVNDGIKGLSDKQWNFKESDDRWSVAQVLEHIAATEDRLFTMITEKVMKAPGRTEAADVKEIDSMVLARIPDRTQKAQAPEEIQPTNRYGSPQAALKHFNESRNKTIAYLKKTSGLRDHAVDSPLGKKLDAYEWLLFMGAHSERHTKQIQQVKDHTKFPSA